MRDAFERSALDRIVSIARPENTASLRIMEKLGLSFEAGLVRGRARFAVRDRSPAISRFPTAGSRNVKL